MRSKLMKIVTIGLFTVAMLLNVSVYFDANDSQNADLSLGSLKVSLFQKAYAGESYSTCNLDVRCFNGIAECEIPKCYGDCDCEKTSPSSCKCTCTEFDGTIIESTSDCGD